MQEQVQEVVVRFVRHFQGFYCRKGEVKKQKTVRRNPPPPFITSKLCSRRPIGKLQVYRQSGPWSVAQNLYEGIDLGDRGQYVGLITYMRTDSFRLSAEDPALEVRDY